jgi:hypothetical protein
MLRFVLISAETDCQRGRDRRASMGWGWLVGLATLQQEFPSITFKTTSEVMSVAPALRVRDWRGLGFNPIDLDTSIVRMGVAAPARLNVIGEPSEETAGALLEILTRYQALVSRRNAHSETASFARVLERHRQLHDTSTTVGLADYLHALDTWQWLLRLRPTASAAAQIAALFHDLDRRAKVSSERVSLEGARNDDVELAHARDSAELALRSLTGLGLDGSTLGRIQQLIADHERPSDDAEVLLLNDADALSFFSLASPAFLDTYGAELTRRKVVLTLQRLRAESWPRLRAIRYRADFERLLVRELRAFTSSKRAAAAPAELRP